jgi:K+-sensing histidine kinase KdpD
MFDAEQNLMLLFEAAHFSSRIVGLDLKISTALPNGALGRRPAVMACLLLGSSNTELLLRTAKLAARRLRGDFFAVYVSPPRESFFRSTSSLDSELTYASSFGAKMVKLVSRDTAGAFLDFARKAGVSEIFIARPQPRPFYRSIFPSPYSALLRRAEGFRIRVVGLAVNQSIHNIDLRIRHGEATHS